MCAGMNRRPRWFAWGYLAVLAAAPLTACRWYERRSVHFHSDRPDFFRAPARWQTRAAPKRALLPGLDRSNPVGEGETRDMVRLIRRARRIERLGRYREAALAWQDVQFAVQRGSIESPAEDGTNALPGVGYDWSLPSLTGLPERIEALRTGSPPAVKRYLVLRDQVSAGGVKADLALKSLRRRPWPEPMERHRRYLMAAAHFQKRVNPSEWDAVVQSYPTFAPALYMAARSRYRLAASRARRVAADFEAAARAYRAASVAARGSLRLDAIRMLGACYYRLGKDPEALEAYLECLASGAPGERDLTAWISARWVVERLSAADHRVFRKRIEGRGSFVPAYLDLLLDYRLQSGESLTELGSFAVQVLERERQGTRDRGVYARLGVILERAGEPERAIRILDRVLPGMLPGLDRDRGQWARAAALKRLGRNREALSAFELLAAQPNIFSIRRGAREAAAVLRERLGDYPGALIHYFALHYELDAAYVLDCLASPVQLKEFLRRYPGHSQARLVRYSIGVRLLRVGDYAGAITQLAPLGTWLDTRDVGRFAQYSDLPSRRRTLDLARSLLRFSRLEQQAQTREDKARWAYESARRVFQERHLVFYNPAAWRGERTTVFERLESDDSHWLCPTYARSEDEKRARYQQEHAAIHQALRGFDRVASEYSGTTWAPRALYLSALCCTLLTSVESYWRQQESRLYRRSVGYYRRLIREYPNDPLVPAARRFGGLSE